MNAKVLCLLASTFFAVGCKTAEEKIEEGVGATDCQAREAMWLADHGHNDIILAGTDRGEDLFILNGRELETAIGHCTNNLPEIRFESLGSHGVDIEALKKAGKIPAPQTP